MNTKTLILLCVLLTCVPTAVALERTFVSAHTGAGPFTVTVPQDTELLVITRHYWWTSTVFSASIGGVSFDPAAAATGSMTAIIYTLPNPPTGTQTLILEGADYAHHVRVYAYTGVDLNEPTGAHAARHGSYEALSLETQAGEEILWAHTRSHLASAPVVQGSITELFNAQVQDTQNTVGYSTGPGTITGGWSGASGATAALIIRPSTTQELFLPGDANRDGRVDVQDLFYVIGRMGARTGDAQFSANADMNGDGIINIFDLVIVARNYGRDSDDAPQPTLTFTATPTTLTHGEQITLTWSAQDASTCTASQGWTGQRATSGSQTLAPTQTTTYTLGCTGLGGVIQQSATVTVYPAQPVITQLTPSASSITVHFTPGGAATSHDVHISTTQEFTPNTQNRVAQGLSGTADRHTISGLTPETTYYIQVVAQNSHATATSAQATQTTTAVGEFGDLYVGMNRASDLTVRTNNTWTTLQPSGWGYARYIHNHPVLSPGHPLEGQYIGEHRIVAEPTVPDGSGQVLEVWYYAHFPSGFEPAVHRFGLPSGTQDVYVGVWYRYRDPDFEWAASKSLLIAADGGFMWWEPRNTFQYNPPPGDPCHVPQGTVDGIRSSISNRDGWIQHGMGVEGICWNVGDPTHTEVVRGEWFLLEFEVRRSDGSGRYWINGELVGQSHNMYWPGSTWQQFQIGHTHGGGVPDKTQDDFIQIGQIMIATS